MSESRKRVLIKTILFIAIIFAILVLIIMGAGKYIITKTSIIPYINEHGLEGPYYLFRTSNAEEYLKFLSELEKQNVEVIDISTGCEGRGNLDSGAYYFITYKKVMLPTE